MAYSSGDVLARVVLRSTTGLTADEINNDFAFHMRDDLAPSSTDIDNIVANLYDFYTHNYGTHQVAYYLGAVNRSYFEIDLYHIVVGALGSPFGGIITTGGGTITAAGAGSGLPAEVAACLSFHGDLTDVLLEDMSNNTRPAARRHGRVYIGPLNTTANDTAGYSRLSDTFRSDLAAAGAGLLASMDADAIDWCVWSRSDVVPS